MQHDEQADIRPHDLVWVGKKVIAEKVSVLLVVVVPRQLDIPPAVERVASTPEFCGRLQPWARPCNSAFTHSARRLQLHGGHDVRPLLLERQAMCCSQIRSLQELARLWTALFRCTAAATNSQWVFQTSVDVTLLLLLVRGAAVPIWQSNYWHSDSG
jgi:hypothetical protein